MNANRLARLGRLEERVDASGDHTTLFERVEAPGCTLGGFRVQNTGRVYAPEAFRRFVQERNDAVFVTLRSTALAKAAAKAYWDEHDANGPTWDQLQAENALVKRIRQEVDDDYDGDDVAGGVSRRIASALGTEGEASREGAAEADASQDEADDDSWVADVTVDSDRATLARYHGWLIEQGAPWHEEVQRRKATLGAGRRV